MFKADNLTIILGHFLVIWETLFPGTLWALRACNGTDLPFLPCINNRPVNVFVCNEYRSVEILIGSGSDRNETIGIRTENNQ